MSFFKVGKKYRRTSGGEPRECLSVVKGCVLLEPHPHCYPTAVLNTPECAKFWVEYKEPVVITARVIWYRHHDGRIDRMIQDRDSANFMVGDAVSHAGDGFNAQVVQIDEVKYTES